MTVSPLSRTCALALDWVSGVNARSVTGMICGSIVGAALMTSVAIAQTASPAATDSAFSHAQRAEIEALVRDYILQHPEIILASVAIMQARQQAEQDEQARGTLVAARDDLERNPLDPILGNPDGSVTLVEFFDYQCGYCKTMMQPILQVLEKDGDVRLVLKEYPILGEVSVFAARASLAAHRQDLYEPFHVALLGLRGRLTEEAVIQVAREVGLNLQTLQNDMNDPEIQAQIEANYALAQALSIQGTPAFTIGGRIIPGAVDEATLAALVVDTRKTAEN